MACKDDSGGATTNSQSPTSGKLHTLECILSGCLVLISVLAIDMKNLNFATKFEFLTTLLP